MGLLDKLKKGKEKRESEEKQHQEQQFQQDLSQKTDSQIRPGSVFMIQLLMKEKYEMPSNERFIEILSKHLGKVEQYGSRKASVSPCCVMWWTMKSVSAAASVPRTVRSARLAAARKSRTASIRTSVSSAVSAWRNVHSSLS